MLTFFVIGLALGIGTSVPVGLVGTAVIDAAYRHSLRRAIAVGLGGGAGDTLYSALGILGFGPLVIRHPGLPPTFCVISGIVLMGYGSMQIRSQPASPDACAMSPGSAGSARGRSETGAGFSLGLGLVIANPSNIVTWVVIVGGLMGGASRVDGIAAVLGVGIGASAWFIVLAHLARRGTRRLGDRSVWIGRIAGTLLFGYGLITVGRGAHYWIAHVWA
jgi:threonine/homoserine/homoserine lactone efflux protein